MLLLVSLFLHNDHFLHKLGGIRIFLLHAAVCILLVLERGCAILVVDVNREHLAHFPLHMLIFCGEVADILGVI